MTTPGEFPDSALVTIAHGERLIASAANAYKALVDDGKRHGDTITPASPGAAYRDAKTQNEMRAGSLGDKPLAAKWDLNPNSSVPLAAHPNGTHEHGDRIDLLFNGSSNPTAGQIALAEKHGWFREFKGDDPNHFEHDGKTDIHYGVPKPAPSEYTVVPGDNLIAIAKHFGTTTERLQELNHLANINRIYVGQRLKLR